jgi:hypothetical protein
VKPVEEILVSEPAPGTGYRVLLGSYVMYFSDDRLERVD